MVYCDPYASPTVSAFVGVVKDEHFIRIGGVVTGCVTFFPVLFQLVEKKKQRAK
jgi:hypothetical protein